MDQLALHLDPRRLHFLTADVDEFRRQSDALLASEELQTMTFLQSMKRRLLKRSRVNMKLAAEALATGEPLDGETSVACRYSGWAVSSEDSAERWRLESALLLAMEMQVQSARESRQFLRTRMAQEQQSRETMLPAELRSTALRALAACFGPHAEWLDADSLSVFRTGVLSNYSIGLPLVIRRGDLWIGQSGGGHAARGLRGLRVIAVSLPGNAPVHLTGLSPGRALRQVMTPSGALGSAAVVILHLEDRAGLRRIDLATDRWAVGR